MRIIIPVYNEEKTIKKVLDSATPLAPCIIVCNGCTDSSVKIIRDYIGDDDKHIIVEVGRGLGCVNAARLAIDVMKKLNIHEDICIVDGDFELDPLQIVCISETADEHPEASIILGSRKREVIPRKSEILISDLLGYNDVMCCLRYFRWELIDKFGYGLIRPIILNDEHKFGEVLEVPVDINEEFMRKSPTMNEDSIYLDCLKEVMEMRKEISG